MPVTIVEVNIEWMESLEHGVPNATRSDGTDVHALKVVRAGDAVGNVPSAIDDLVVGGDVVANQGQHLHDYMLRHRDRVAVGDLRHSEATVDRRLKIHVIRADAGGEAHLEVLGLGDALRGHVCGPEGLRDHNIGVDEFSLKHGVLAILVVGHHKSVAAVFEELAEAELAGDGTKKVAGCEVNLGEVTTIGSGLCALSDAVGAHIRIVGYEGDVVASVLGWVA